MNKDFSSCIQTKVDEQHSVIVFCNVHVLFCSIEI